MFQSTTATLLRIATGVQIQPESSLPSCPAVYFANHTSHLDFLTIWAALPPSLRNLVRPVAAKDYWEKTPLHHWLATRIFQAHLICRKVSTSQGNPIDLLSNILHQGQSLILFPEGTRSKNGRVQALKSGLYHLAKQHANLPLVPIHLENMNRILPKGELLPLPLLGKIEFRSPIYLQNEESKHDFLQRAKQAIQAHNTNTLQTN